MKIIITENQLKKILSETINNSSVYGVEKLYELLNSIDDTIKAQSYGSMQYNPKVEAVQIALTLLGYELPRYGIDGLFGPETSKALGLFVKDNLTESRIIKEAADIAGIDELVYNPVTGPNGTVGFGYDSGKKVTGISWNNHNNHLHVGFTNKEVAMNVIDKARELGLRTGENWYPNGSVNPVHTSNSFHYRVFPGTPKVGGGVDITGDKKKIEELIIWVNKEYAGKNITPTETIGLDDGSKSKTSTSSEIGVDLVQKLIEKLEDKNIKDEDVEKALQNRKSVESEVNNKIQSIQNKDSFIISTANKKDNKYSLVFGGSPSSKYGASYMKEQVGNLINNKNFIFSNYENPIESLTSELKKINPKAEIKSVTGFSRGGQKIWNLIGQYDMVAFIDPVPPTTSIPSTSGNDTLLIYDPRNLKGSNKLDDIASKIGNNAEIKKFSDKDWMTRHLKLPSYFFSKYGNRI